MSPQLRDYPRYAWQLLAGVRSWMEQETAGQRERDLAGYLDTNRPLTILDVANGRLRPQYAILRGAGHRVYGVDLINRPRRSPTDLAYTLARRMYTWRLGLAARTGAADTLVCSDVGRLPFPNSFFDLATSVAAFEHFLDLPAVLAELARVLRPGGMLWVSVHLFTSPSGGHNLSFSEYPLASIPAGVEPWDHLRRRTLPFSVPLNQWRKQQYLAAFAKHFAVIKSYCLTREGEQWLTPALRAELADYSADELTCAAFAIVARKPVV